MKRVPLFFALFLLLRPHAFATWSVLAVSQISGRVVIASATCLALEPPQTLMKIQAVQFGIVDLEGRAAAFSGNGTNAVSTSVQGSIPAEKIFFSIQGNLVRTEGVVPEAACECISHCERHHYRSCDGGYGSR